MKPPLSQQGPFSGPTCKARPRWKCIRSTIGDKLRELRLLQRLTPQQWSLEQPLHDKTLEAHVLWARIHSLSFRQVKQAAAEEFADLVAMLRKRYESGDRTALGEIVAGERRGEPWLIEEDWYKAAIVKELFSAKPLPVRGKGKTSSLSVKERQERRRASSRKAGTRRNLQRAAQRLVQEYERQKRAFIRMGRDEKRATEDALRYIIKEFQETSPAKDKPAILAIFKKILRAD